MPTELNKFFIVLFGPTAVGKTDLSLELAQHLSAEIVNMDVGQFYAPLSIGTAKPAWRSEPIPHHMFDLIDTPRDYTVVEYRAQALKTMEKIWARNKIPVLVGGSGFYLSSLFFPPAPGIPETTSPVPALSKHDQDPQALWAALNSVDPTRAAAIHPHDIYRLKRALHLWYTTNQKPSERQTTYQPPASCLIALLTRDRAELYSRINERVLHMMAHGFQEEVEQLRETPWETFLNKKGLIGYPDLFEYLSGERTPALLSSTIQKIQQKTRAYGKRQETFWRMFEKKINAHEQSEGHTVTTITINLTIPAGPRYISDLLKHLSPFFHGCMK